MQPSEINKHDRINNAGSRPIRNFSNFKDDLPYRFAGTYRFGEYAPHFVTDVVENEKHRFRCAHTVRSYTMQKPLLQNIKMNKSYFFVPYSAILPFNYEKYQTIPNQGDDVNPSLVGTSVDSFIGRLGQLAVDLYGVLSSASFGNSQDVFRYVVWYDMMFSDGGLLPYLGCHIGDGSADSQVDQFWYAIAQWLEVSSNHLRLTFGSKTFEVGKPASNLGDGSISLHEAISRMRDDFSFTCSCTGDFSGVVTIFGSYCPVSPVDVSDDAPLDIARPIAYQLSCAHFFSNNHVDYIYTAELYRQNLRSAYRDYLGNIVDATFSYNGVDCYYDTCSAFMLYQVFIQAGSGVVAADFPKIFDIFRLIFGYNRSLRYGDYFTGSRTLPLAVGDTRVAVNGGYVSVVESIQKSWVARLLAQIQRVGHSLNEQSKALYPDVNVVQDWHDPVWLSTTEDDIFPEEVDNTSDAQYQKDISVTSVLNAAGENFGFQTEIPNRVGVILGITSFEIARFYSRNIERNFFLVDRYDKFNPFLQFNGDQKIYRKELDCRTPSLTSTFAYTGRYKEYKQRYNQCAGGFSNGVLPGMIFVADQGRDELDIDNLSPDYIRSYPSELDDFFLSLSGYSLGTYFHFIIVNTNYDDADKPMAYNPQLD